VLGGPGLFGHAVAVIQVGAGLEVLALAAQDYAAQVGRRQKRPLSLHQLLAHPGRERVGEIRPVDGDDGGTAGVLDLEGLGHR
jgi:hypothetical protein